MEKNLEKLFNQRFDTIEEKISDLCSSNKEEHQRLIDKVDYTNGNVMDNTKFRISMESQVKVWIGLATFFGLSGITNVVLFVIK